jgi:ribosomal protein S18 acetylase RimI-like enzyme
MKSRRLLPGFTYKASQRTAPVSTDHAVPKLPSIVLVVVLVLDLARLTLRGVSWAMAEITIREFNPEMTDDTADMLARAFVTNPLNIAVFGVDQLSVNKAFFRGGLRVMRGRKLVALDGARIIGFIHWVTSPRCQFSTLEKLAMLPGMIQEFGLSRSLRISAWLGTWSKHDPKDAHCHLGPIGIDPAAQGRGIGQRLMTLYCQDLDQTAIPGYLETDRPENVAFYRRFGFEVTAEIPILGVPNFLMRRPAN